MKKYLNIIKIGFTNLFVASLLVLFFSSPLMAQSGGDPVTCVNMKTKQAISYTDSYEAPSGGDWKCVKAGDTAAYDALIKEADEKNKTSDVTTEKPKSTSNVSGGGSQVAYSSSIGGDGCSDAKNPFETIACKAMKTLNDLKILIYILSGFGLVVFTWGAIFGKINWNHLASLGIGLFLVTMMVPFIAMFVTDGGSTQKFQKWGDQISGEEYLLRSNGLTKIPGESGGNALAPTASGEAGSDIAETPKQKWGLKDLAGSVKSAAKTVKSTAATVSAAKKAVTQISAGIKAGTEGLKDLDLTDLDSIQKNAVKIASASSSIASASSTLGNTVQKSASLAMDSANDIGQTNEGRELNAQQRSEGKQTNAISAAIKGESTGVTRGSDLKYRDAKGNVVEYAEKDGKVVDANGKVVGVLDSKGRLLTESKTAGLVKTADKTATVVRGVDSKVKGATRDSAGIVKDAEKAGIGGGLANTAGVFAALGGVTGAVVEGNKDSKAIAKKEQEAYDKEEAKLASTREKIAKNEADQKKRAEEKAAKALEKERIAEEKRQKAIEKRAEEEALLKKLDEEKAKKK